MNFRQSARQQYFSAPAFCHQHQCFFQHHQCFNSRVPTHFQNTNGKWNSSSLYLSSSPSPLLSLSLFPRTIAFSAHQHFVINTTVSFIDTSVSNFRAPTHFQCTNGTMNNSSLSLPHNTYKLTMISTFRQTHSLTLIYTLYQ